MSSPPQSSAARDHLASLVARCILACEQEGESAVDALLQAEPALAAGAREQLESLRAAGMLSPALPDPEQIGPYRILQRLGTGGMGTVYLAEQEEPLRRRVALKVIRPGMDTREVLARFAIERQALALLDHPGIAHVLDAGTTSDGRPYLCMEYVGGQPITRYCDERGLALEDRIELFARVCDAVQAAHQKGILHRDLKPTNVLVTDRDGKPWPCIIDFGVAKSVGPRLVDVTLFTMQGRMIGTPEYMSPEQAANELDIDTRTDVFSLGVVLYQLLVGALPIESQRLRGTSHEEMVRVLRQEEPPTPSTRLQQLGDAAAELAKKRRLDRQALRRRLRGDLDWIAMKALEKDRNRRYGMAAELAADLRRHLQSEPVTAGPPGAWYRWRKFIGRHRLQAASLAAVFCALLTGLVFSWVFWREAVAKERESDTSLDVALAAVDRMVLAGEERLDIVPRMESVRRQLLEEALVLHRRLAAAGDDPRLRQRTARALSGLGGVQAQLGLNEEAVKNLRAAHAMLRTVPVEELQRTEAAHLTASLPFALAMALETVSGPPGEVSALIAESFERIEVLLQQVRPDASFRSLAVTILNRRANDLVRQDVEASRALYLRVVELARPFWAEGSKERRFAPQGLLAAARYGFFLVDVGEPGTARSFADELGASIDRLMTEAGDPVDQARYLPALAELATIRYRTGQFEEVVRDIDRALPIYRRLVSDFPGVLANRARLATAVANRGCALQQLSRHAEAAADLQEALDMFVQLRREHPEASAYRARLLGSCAHVIHMVTHLALLGAQVDWSPAEKAMAIGDAEVAILPAERGRDLSEMLAEFHRACSEAHGKCNRTGDAIRSARLALAEIESLCRGPVATVLLQGRRVDVQKTLARNLLAQGEVEEALTLIEAARRGVETVGDRAGTPEATADVRCGLIELQARAELRAGRFDRLLERFDALLAANFAPAMNWGGHDMVAGMALEAAKALPDTPQRAAFLQRVRDEVAAGTGLAAGMGSVAHAMVAIQRANSLRILVSAERLAGRAKDAALAQAGVVDGYLGAFTGRKNERNRTRLSAAFLELVDLLLMAGETDGARAQAEAMAAAFTGEGMELARAANCLVRTGTAVRAVQVLESALAAGLKDTARLREGEEFALLRSCAGAMAVIDAIGR